LDIKLISSGILPEQNLGQSYNIHFTPAAKGHGFWLGRDVASLGRKWVPWLCSSGSTGGELSD
jgi:hypothetical protein